VRFSTYPICRLAHLFCLLAHSGPANPSFSPDDPYRPNLFLPVLPLLFKC